MAITSQDPQDRVRRPVTRRRCAALFLDPRNALCTQMGGFLATRPGGRLKRGSGFDLTSLCCYVRSGACGGSSVRCGTDRHGGMGLGEWSLGESAEEWKRKEVACAHERTADRVLTGCDLGLVTAVVAKHTVMHCLGGSSLVSLGLWTILNS